MYGNIGKMYGNIIDIYLIIRIYIYICITNNLKDLKHGDSHGFFGNP